MDSWFRDRIYQDKLVLLSESGFTNDTLAIRFLNYFIQYTSTGLDQLKKLLLMDNHGSYIIPKFIQLATQNNIVPFTFPVHLIYCIQPCDISLFIAYKH
jgi:hypothetical protein